MLLKAQYPCYVAESPPHLVILVIGDPNIELLVPCFFVMLERRDDFLLYCILDA
jgi:hypothetical protein